MNRTDIAALVFGIYIGVILLIGPMSHPKVVLSMLIATISFRLFWKALED